MRCRSYKKFSILLLLCIGVETAVRKLTILQNWCFNVRRQLTLVFWKNRFCVNFKPYNLMYINLIIKILVGH